MNTAAPPGRHRQPAVTFLALLLIVIAVACRAVEPEEAVPLGGDPAALPANPTSIVSAEVTPVAAPSEPAVTPIPTITSESRSGALRIGFLADFSGPLADFSPEIRRGAELAVLHVNAAGGVGGLDVTLVDGDTRIDPTRGVEEARRLIDVEGVHAFVGPLSSAVTLAVAEHVTAVAMVPVITPSGTSPALAEAYDDGFLFRSTVSDAAQGVVLARLATEEGFTNAGVLYSADAYGEGLAEAFRRSYDGSVTSVPYSADGQLSYLAELRQVAAGGAEVLIAIGFSGEAIVFVREALEHGLFSRFLFVDGTKSEDLIAFVGAARLEGSKGTAPGAGPATPSSRAWAEAYIAEYGELTTLPFVREAYDATIALALAAESAGSLDGTAIRDHLARIASPGGELVPAGVVGVTRALNLIRSGQDINYEGAATSLDWNSVGDVRSGYITIWEYTRGEIVTLESVLFTID